MNRGLASAIGAWLFCAFYLAQQLTLSPGQVDEGLTLNFVRQVSEGKRVFWDFFDVYGPIHYWPPAFFYLAFGKHVVGVRVWILLVKMASVAAVYRLVSAAARKLDAWLAVAWTTVLLGLPWQALQNAYAFLHCVPFIVIVQYLLVCEPLPTRRANAVLAGVLTATTLFIKVSSGAFLLAGGVLYSFCWSVPSVPAGTTTGPVREGRVLPAAWLRGSRVGLVLACGVTFLLFVRRKIDPLFYLYFDVPLVFAVALTLDSLRAESRDSPAASHRMSMGLTFAGSCIAAAAAFFVAYFGFSGGARYVRELAILFSRMTYEHALLPLGKPGLYRGFTDFYWMQYPWLLTALAAAWAVLGSKGRGAAAYGDAWPLHRARAGGLWVFSSLGMFAAYAYGIEVHFLAAFLATGASFFVLLSQARTIAVCTWMAKHGGNAPRWADAATVVVVAAWLSTLAFVPRLDPFRARVGQWTVSEHGGHSAADNRLRGLAFLETNRVGMRDLSPDITDTELDRAANDAAAFLDDITQDGDEIFNISKNEIVTFHSFTKTPWERYRVLFYYVREHIIDRATFEMLVPNEVIRELVRNPPRIAVVDRGDRPRIIDTLPALATLGRMYRVVRVFPTLMVLARADAFVPVRP